eukprot:3935273-Rhodomonas_salina.2
MMWPSVPSQTGTGLRFDGSKLRKKEWEGEEAEEEYDSGMEMMKRRKGSSWSILTPCALAGQRSAEKGHGRPRC